MNIDDIIYETTRGIYSIDDKLGIATIFLFCQKLSNKLFAELLYTDNHENFLAQMNQKYSKFKVDFTIILNDKNVNNSFYTTLEKVKRKYDNDGFYKALFKGDEFALVVDELVNYNFDKVGFKQ